MKRLLTFLLLILVSCCPKPAAQEPKVIEPFTLDVEQFVHSELLEGVLNYHITQDSLVIFRKAGIEIVGEDNSNDTLVARKLTRSEALLQLSKTDLSHLSESYINDRVMLTSGEEIFVGLKRKGKTKEIHLHAMRIPSVNRIFKLLNEIVPKEYQLK